MKEGRIGEEYGKSTKEKRHERSTKYGYLFRSRTRSSSAACERYRSDGEPRPLYVRPLLVSDVKPVELKIRDEAYRLDGNNVDPEREMAVMAETRMMYNAMNRLAAKKLAIYRTVIAGR